MALKSVLRSSLFAVVAISWSGALAQGAGVRELLNQTTYPETQLLSKLPEGYKASRIKVPGSSNGMFDGPTGMMMFLMSDGDRTSSQSQRQMGLLSLIDVCWTKGETAIAAGIEYLVTYRFDPNPIQLVALSESPDLMGAITLSLCFIRSSEITSITPLGDLGKAFQGEGAPPLEGGMATVPGEPGQLGSRLQAQRTATLSNVKQAALGMIMYCADYDDVYPWAQSSKSAWSVIYPYVKNRDTFKTLNPNGGELRFAANVAGASAVDLEAPASVVMIYESMAWPDGSRVVAYCDGHARVISADAWKEAEKELKRAYKRKAKRPLPADYDPSGMWKSGG
ncbi:MAG: hypothetical protein HZC36_01805 [Armatimonadetes bacterium]|nr:hypothetical protein [Armatimonadota bacterium]